jgi:hypothetical protein
MKKLLLSFAVLIALVACMSSRALAQVKITNPGDPITGIWQTTIGGNSTTSTAGTANAGQYPAGEPPAQAIDGRYTNPYGTGPTQGSKYLNFGTGGGGGISTITKGVGTGYFVTPALGPSIVTGIQIATANDAAPRDPLTVSIEGSNATGAALELGSSWTLISDPVTHVNLGIDTDPGRYILAPIVTFPNTTQYTSYRVLVQTQRGSANSTQYGELTLHGIVIPEPSTVALAAAGLLGLVVAVRRRRR